MLLKPSYHHNQKAMITRQLRNKPVKNALAKNPNASNYTVNALPKEADAALNAAVLVVSTLTHTLTSFIPLLLR